METIVLSGINLFEGGTLSIYLDCLDCLVERKIYEKYHIIAFVHNRKMFEAYQDYVEIIEKPKSRKSYLFRLYYEYIYFYMFSRKRNITYWLSLHDMTPNVKAEKKYTYCHNPAPFMDNPESVKKLSRNIYYTAKFYKYIYRINIKKCTAVIVQQEWLRRKFHEMFGIENIIVAIPEIQKTILEKQQIDNSENRIKNRFIYASYPRAFKNFEVIGKAASILEKDGYEFEVLFTIDGNENKYSKFLYEKYSDIKAIKWLGLQKRDKVFELYGQSDCMIFPSKLETWGLPISEYKNTGKPLLLADLPYAHETVGEYDKVKFFEPSDSVKLAEEMKNFMDNKIVYDVNQKVDIRQPYAEDWNELFEMILKNKMEI